MATKFYVIWQGRETGIFTDWNTCKKHVEKFAGAKYKSFKTRSEAEAAFHGKATSASSSARKSPQSKTSSAKTIKTYTAIEISAMPIDTKVFTDGACSPNPGKAGTGIAIYRSNHIDELWYGIYNASGTNNTAELNGLKQALIIAKSELDKSKTVAIFCDSKYSIQCITQWAVGWQKKGWKKNGGEIKNLDLIKEIFSLYQLLKDKVQILHVNGHVGVEGNELADRMSMVAIDTKEPNFSLYRDALDIPAILAMRAG
ncbi:MAG: ribonuclease HI [Methylococcaceae bacterium]|nr:ribonuclease HI [Methylococcaceae bacterium]